MPTPLRKCYPNGDIYKRPEIIENAIDNLLNESLENLISRTTISDASSLEYVPSECLVHLIRTARCREDEPIMTALVPVLLRRCETIVLSKISSDLPRAEEIREEILGQFAELLAADGITDTLSELDFFEVHFNEAFRTFRIDIFRKEQRKNRVRGQSSIPTFHQDASETSSDDEFFVKLSKVFHAEPSQQREFVHKQILRAIDALPEEERKAIVLCCILGYQQESEDPQKRTAATICGVTGKTIHNRLRRAASRLSQFKELIQ